MYKTYLFLHKPLPPTSSLCSVIPFHLGGQARNLSTSLDVFPFSSTSPSEAPGSMFFHPYHRLTLVLQDFESHNWFIFLYSHCPPSTHNSMLPCRETFLNQITSFSCSKSFIVIFKVLCHLALPPGESYLSPLSHLQNRFHWYHLVSALEHATLLMGPDLYFPFA